MKILKKMEIERLRRNKVYIVLTFLFYLIALNYAGLNFSWDFGVSYESISEHKCLNHKFHPSLKDLAVVLTTQFNYFHTRLYSLTSPPEISNPLFVKSILFIRSDFHLLLPKRAPPLS
jgi:hypothetical protein